MKLNKLIATLTSAGLRILRQKRNGDDTGWRVEIAGGAIVNLYDTGNLNVQGKNPQRVRVLLEKWPASKRRTLNTVLVVGRKGKARAKLAAMLKRWKVQPLFVDELTCPGRTAVEKVEHARRDASFAVVLATRDDEGHKANRPEQKARRASQKVVLELGMMLAHFGRWKVAVLSKGKDADRKAVRYRRTAVH
jgi:predicted nucleotide-binding protein